ncbi:MAG: endonuclease Q family protein, partial [Candidatus Micrarchaeaceae archaeon]
MLPTLESVKELRGAVRKYGQIDSDGRTPLSMSSAALVEKVFEIDRRAFVFPAHVWTPFFGALGARSGFDSLKDAYEDQEKHIHALETGLSSDPEMNWRISALDKYTLLSNSDMHSLPKLGREANMFEFDEKGFTYNSIIGAIKNKDGRHLKKTIEFYPEEGKYHYDGHKDCGYSADPSANKPTVCPVCGKKLVIGVLHRINDLADRPVGYVPKDAIPSVHIVPLREIISYVIKKGPMTMAVEKQYQSLISTFGSEFDILMDANLEDIAKASTEDMAEAVKNVRQNKVNITPGYAGVFGEVDLLHRQKGRTNTLGIKQRSLFDVPKA